MFHQEIKLTRIPKKLQRTYSMGASVLGCAILHSDPSANSIRFTNKAGKELDIRLTAFKKTRVVVQVVIK